MKKQKKQTVLTAIIAILVLSLIAMIASIVYEEAVNMNNQKLQETIVPEVSDKIDDIMQKDEISEDNESESEEVKDEIIEKEEFVGEEEQKIEKESGDQENSKSDDEKAIDLAKKEWGNDDSVTFDIEKKKNTKYYISVNKGAAVLQWYEVDTETWAISEY